MAASGKKPKIAGIAEIGIDPEKGLVEFTLATEGSGPAKFIIPLNVLDQVLQSLAAARHQTQARMAPLRSQATQAEEISQYLVRADPLSRRILLRLVATNGIPYTFALPMDVATDISDRLKIEVLTDGPTGHA